MCNGERPTRLTPHEPLSAAGTPLQTATGKPQSLFEFGSKARESISAREPPPARRHATPIRSGLMLTSIFKK